MEKKSNYKFGIPLDKKDLEQSQMPTIKEPTVLY